MQDLIIIGGGPAGCSAAVYARRFYLDATLIFDRPGGLIATAHKIENWPGIKEMGGFEFGQTLLEHARALGAECVTATVERVEKLPDGNFRVTASGQTYTAKTVLIASGTLPRQLGIPGEQELQGKGVSYCAVCDANFFKGKTVAVIGGSDSCCNEAELLAEIADKVYLIYRRSQLRAEDANVRGVENHPKVEILYNTTLQEIRGTDRVEGALLSDGSELALDGVFVAIGREPLTGVFDGIDLDFSPKGEILIDENNGTKTSGVFAAGDVVPGIKQAIVAAASGVSAVFGVREYLKKLEQN